MYEEGGDDAGVDDEIGGKVVNQRHWQLPLDRRRPRTRPTTKAGVVYRS